MKGEIVIATVGLAILGTFGAKILSDTAEDHNRQQLQNCDRIGSDYPELMGEVDGLQDVCTETFVRQFVFLNGGPIERLNATGQVLSNRIEGEYPAGIVRKACRSRQIVCLNW